MKSVILVLFLVLIFVGCHPYKPLIIENKTGYDIGIHIIPYDSITYSSLPQDIMKSSYMENNNLTLPNGSSYFISYVFNLSAKKQQRGDSAIVEPFHRMVITSECDTFHYSKKDLVKKVHEIWNEHNNNPDLKLKTNEKNILIWEFKK